MNLRNYMSESIVLVTANPMITTEKPYETLVRFPSVGSYGTGMCTPSE